MTQGGMNVVTGAFGYTGRHVAQRLLAQGGRVTTLTGRPNRPNPFGNSVRALPFDFDDPARMSAQMEGAQTLYNTYWIRFERDDLTFDVAVRRVRSLIDAAKRAGVSRIVHISITNASADSPLPYFRGKAQLEEAVRESGLSYAIVKPAVIFGDRDILLNNIAWFLRRFPVTPVFGRGDYRLQPVSAEDLADLAVRAGRQTFNVEFDAVGPETFRYDELLETIARAVGARSMRVRVPPSVGYAMTSIAGYLLKDVVITRDEVEGLMQNLLVSAGPPTAEETFTAWLRDNAATLGVSYASEMERHYR